MRETREMITLVPSMAMNQSSFLEALDSKGGKYKWLADLCRRNNHINIKIFEEEGFVCICCHIDRKLIEWAKTPFKFPRGFIADITEGDIKFRGFLPKFANDDRNQEIVEGEYEDFDKVIITPKISGFLINIIVVKGVFRLVNKNSYGTDFTDKANEIFDAWVATNPSKAEALKARCIVDGLTLSAEFMHVGDKMHGYVARRNCFAVTCIASSDDAEDAALRYFAFDEKDSFCREFDLPFLPSWSVEGDVSGFMVEFNKGRDNMTYRSFELLMAIKATVLEPGNFDHLTNVGDTLEGAIVFGEKTDGQKEIKKVKLPQYTCCTMIFRQNVGSRLTKSLIRKVKKGVRAWTVTPEGYTKWLNITLTAFDLAGRVDDADAYIDAGLHAETWLRAIHEPAPLTEETFRIKHGIGTKSQLPLVVVVGPVGYGKSSLGNAIAGGMARGHHIDGDTLDLGEEAEVLRLGKERTPYSLYKIAEAWMHGTTPVISTGGGILDDVENVVVTMFPDHELNLVVFVPENFRSVYPVWKVDDAVTRRLDSGAWTLPGGQKVDKFIAKIQKLSAANVKFAGKLFDAADKVYTFPALVPETASIYNTFPVLDYLDKLSRSTPTSLTYKQYRVLATCPQVPKYGHITLEFVHDGDGAGGAGGAEKRGYKSMDATDVVAADHAYTDEVDAIILTIKAKKGCQLVVIPENKVVRVLNDAGEPKTHVTVNAGSHAPVKMGDVAAAFLKGEGSVQVDDVTYDLTKAKQVKTKLKMCGIFFM